MQSTISLFGHDIEKFWLQQAQRARKKRNLLLDLSAAFHTTLHGPLSTGLEEFLYYGQQGASPIMIIIIFITSHFSYNKQWKDD